MDLDRLELQRVQFESDFETAMVNLRTAKIQLLMLLNDRTPIEQFDVTGPFDFTDELKPLEEFRNIALEARPDLKVAVQNVELAKITHQLAVANGSTDPTFSVWYSHNPSFTIRLPTRRSAAASAFRCASSTGIRARRRARRSISAATSDCGTPPKRRSSTMWIRPTVTLVQNVNLLRPYKAKYLKLATDIRDRMSFSYQNGGASLLDYLDAEKAYRDTRLAYLNLIGSYLTAAAQMNMAVGREVLQ